MKITKLKNILNDEKIRRLLIICGALGIGLIFLSTFIELPKDNNSYDITAYKEQIQTSLNDMLNQVDGVGECSVLITMENSAEGVYLQNSSTKTKEIEPKIRGVVVACFGGDDPVVIGKVSEIVTKVLNISSARVCVTKLDSKE